MTLAFRHAIEQAGDNPTALTGPTQDRAQSADMNAEIPNNLKQTSFEGNTSMLTNLMQEDLARSQMQERMRRAAEERRMRNLLLAKRMQRRAERASLRARRALAAAVMQ